jgi:hypothetical protein
MTYRSHRMQKAKFSVMCPDVFFMETILGAPDHKK